MSGKQNPSGQVVPPASDTSGKFIEYLCWGELFELSSVGDPSNTKYLVVRLQREEQSPGQVEPEGSQAVDLPECDGELPEPYLL